MTTSSNINTARFNCGNYNSVLTWFTTMRNFDHTIRIKIDIHHHPLRSSATSPLHLKAFAVTLQATIRIGLECKDKVDQVS